MLADHPEDTPRPALGLPATGRPRRPPGVRALRHDYPMDFAAQGLLDGLEGNERLAREQLLARLIASRVTAIARPGSVLCTQDVRDEAGEASIGRLPDATASRASSRRSRCTARTAASPRPVSRPGHSLRRRL